MKIFLSIILLFLLLNCSFDNKTGIWKNSNQVDVDKRDRFADFEKLYTIEKSFDSIIAPDNNLKISIDPIKSNLKWLDEYYQDSNNLDNFSYKNLNQLIFKSKRLSKHKINNKLFFEDSHVIIADDKGNIIVYSVAKKKIVFKYNFYKKKIKKIKKNLNIIIEKNIIFIGDNLGYLYALNYINGKLLWAKNYKIPFRSNLKILKNTIVLSDINNSLHFINKLNGEKLKSIPTEETILKNNFFNSLASIKDSIFYLNTYGSLYSINNNGQINWFLNLKQSLDENSSNLFFSNPIALHQDKLIVSSDPYLYIFNSNTGAAISKIAISSIFKPIVSGKNIFLITKDNLLVCLNLDTGSIIYSVEINQEIANYLKTKKKSINIKSMALLNDNLFLFLNNSFLIQFSVEGKVKNIDKLPNKLGSLPIFIKDSIIYLNNKNKLIIIN